MMLVRFLCYIFQYTFENQGVVNGTIDEYISLAYLKFPALHNPVTPFHTIGRK